MAAGEVERKEFYHIQTSPYRFQSKMYAPEKGTTVPRFAVEVMVYVSGSGLDIVDPLNSGNELMIAFRNYVRMKELMGYHHLGKSSEELSEMMKNLWGKST